MQTPRDDPEELIARLRAENAALRQQQAAAAREYARLLDDAQALQAAAADRARELTALLEVARSLTSTLELEPLLALILEQLLRVLDYRSAGITVVRDEAAETVAMRDTRDRSRELRQVGERVPLAQLTALWHMLLRGEPVLIGDVRRDDDPLAHAWRTATGRLGRELLSIPVRDWLASPLSVWGQVFGFLGLTREAPHRLTAH